MLKGLILKRKNEAETFSYNVFSMTFLYIENKGKIEAQEEEEVWEKCIYISILVIFLYCTEPKCEKRGRNVM